MVTQKKQETIKTSKREIRMAEMRLAQSEPDSMVVEGYAIVFDSPTTIWEYNGIEYKEVIARGALTGTDMSDIPFKYNHSDDVMIMARTRNGTLVTQTDDKGLLIRATLANTSSGRDLYELIKRKDIDKMSFAFTVTSETYDEDTHTRTINKIKKLYDVAAVDMPAYDDTSISARSFFESAEKRKNTRDRLRLMTYL